MNDIGDSAEYFMASELLLRGILAQPTFGNKKKMDLIIRYVLDDLEKFKIIEVKSKRKTDKFSMIKGIPLKKTYIIVFLDYYGKQLSEKPDIYILNHEDWHELIKRLIEEEINKCKISNRKRTSYSFKWIQDHENCEIEREEDEEKSKFSVRDLDTNESLHVASIIKAEGCVEWKKKDSKDSKGIDVPIDAISVFKDKWDKIKEDID